MKVTRDKHKRSNRAGWSSTRITATVIGVFFGLFSGMNHGLFEILQGNKPTNGLIIQAIGESQRFWPLGTEEALTVIPNFLITGIVSMLFGAAIVIWTICFLPSKHGRSIYLILFSVSFLVGGGIGQLVFFVPAWAFATRMDKPLSWWKTVLPEAIRPFLAKIWGILLIAATAAISIGLEMAIFGIFPGLHDPDRIQGTALLFVSSSALLYMAAFIAGFNRDLLTESKAGEYHRLTLKKE